MARLALGGCVLTVVAARGAPALQRWYTSERSSAIELTTSAELAKTAIRTRSIVADSLEARRRLLEELAPRFFTGATLNSAASGVGAYVTKLARSANVELGAFQISLDSTRSAGLRRVSLTASARGDVHGLMQLIASLEAGNKLTRVTALSVSQPDVAGRIDAPEALNIQLTVHALARAGGPR